MNSITKDNPKVLTCFKAYDIRGRLGEELDEAIAYRIGRAFADYIKPQRVVIGSDIRLSSETLKHAVAEGLMDAGADVLDLGLTGTEEIYFAAFYLDVDGGIEITASHNPIDFNGMKLVRKGARPISGDTGLNQIRKFAEENCFAEIAHRGQIRQFNIVTDYVQHLLAYIDLNCLKPLRLVVNAGNGAAGHVIDIIEQQFKLKNIPVEFIKIHHEPDGTFPQGIPNPLLPENRHATREAVLKNNADMGIAWDGDFDRCFLFDEQGEFIEGYYIVGLLAEAFLIKHPGQKVIHDPRLTWNTIDIVKKAGGIPIQSKTGHAFIKERMRKENAIYGGEMSAHHYFREFAYCDSGMIPWLLVVELICKRKQPLSQMVSQQIKAYPISGEINSLLPNPEAAIEKVKHVYAPKAERVDDTDGLSIEFTDWRFNLRRSNTEPLVRLNVESRLNVGLLNEKTQAILKLLKSN